MARTLPEWADGWAVLLLGLGSVAYFCFLFVWFLTPAFLTPIIAELGLSSTQAGLLTGAIPLIYIPLSLSSGLVVDRIGSRRAIGVGLIVLGLAGGVRGVAPGFPSLLGLTLLIGVGGTGITFGLPKVVSDLFPPERSGTATSVYLIGSYLGTAAAFGLGRPVLGPWLGGWRGVFGWSGVVVAAFGAAWLLTAARSPRASAMTGASGGASSPKAGFRADAAAVLGHRGLRRLVVVGTMYLFLLHGLQAWLTTVLEGRGFATAVAASITSILIIARVIGTVTIPPFSDRWRMRRGMIVVCGGGLLAGALGLTGAGGDHWVTVGAVVLAGLGLGGVSPLIRSIPIEMDGIGPERTGTATGLIFSIGEIGGFAGPFLLGVVHDATGEYTAGILLMAMAAVGLIIAGAMITGVDGLGEGKAGNG